MRDQNGKSGLAFKDKLFLFLSDQNSDNEIRALLVHEYNHVCRLAKNGKQEENYVLLDSIILEGLAENAVRELVGEEYLAKWTSYYTEGQLNQMWKKSFIQTEISQKAIQNIKNFFTVSVCSRKCSVIVLDTI